MNIKIISMDTLRSSYLELETNIDEANNNIRNGYLTTYDFTLFNDICSVLDNEPFTQPIRLYRGLGDFDEKYLRDPGIVFKTGDINYALVYGNNLLIIDYPSSSKQIHITDYEEEDAYISYPNERFVLTRIESYSDNITAYYLEFVGYRLEYDRYYDPSKEDKIKHLSREMISRIKKGELIELYLVNPDEIIQISNNIPYEVLTNNIIFLKTTISNIIYQNRLINYLFRNKTFM
jgi:hypothetical protein